MADDDAELELLSRPGIAAEALAGLLQPQKTLPAKLFYDEEGCRLFQRITALPEYYLTRTELQLLADVAPRVAGAVPAGGALVEYGASDETKADFLLRQRGPEDRPAFRAYVPIDIAAQGLQRLRERMHRTHPTLAVHEVATDFLRPLTLPAAVAGMRRLGFFPGSTIGNLEPPVARRFLAQARRTLGPGAAFLVGADLRKDPAVLIPAYDDAQGVTAAFNRNLLTRLNREARADFDPDAFAHRAVWNDAESRIEMHLVSRRAQLAHVDGCPIPFAAGESIHTENSYKHTAEDFAALAENAGWQRNGFWTDDDNLFSLHLLTS